MAGFPNVIGVEPARGESVYEVMEETSALLLSEESLLLSDTTSEEVIESRAEVWKPDKETGDLTGPKTVIEIQLPGKAAEVIEEAPGALWGVPEGLKRGLAFVLNPYADLCLLTVDDKPEGAEELVGAVAMGWMPYSYLPPGREHGCHLTHLLWLPLHL